MWSTIFKTKDQEFDAVPNSWLIDASTCKYPDKSSARVMRYARDCKDVEDDWLILDISIVQKDYSKYAAYSFMYLK